MKCHWNWHSLHTPVVLSNLLISLSAYAGLAAIDRLQIIWEFDLSDKVKREIFQAEAILLQSYCLVSNGMFEKRYVGTTQGSNPWSSTLQNCSITDICLQSKKKKAPKKTQHGMPENPGEVKDKTLETFIYGLLHKDDTGLFIKTLGQHFTKLQ